MGFYLQGLTMGLAYVAPIGMQNLFVINSALTKTRRKAVFTAIIVTIRRGTVPVMLLWRGRTHAAV